MIRPPVLLSAEAVHVERPSEDGQMQEILHGVTMDVSPGEVSCLIGPSGGGKSTLLRLFNRLIEPSSGQVLFDGKDLRTLDPPQLRSQVTLVPQKPYLFPGTVQQNIEIPARFNGTPRIDITSQETAELLEICQVDSQWLARDARRLSLGQQQRVCLVRALVGRSRVLLLDEPTSALDRPTADALSPTFRRLAEQKGLAIILVTHNLRVAEQSADRLIVLIDGDIHAQGPYSEVIATQGAPQVEAFLRPDPTVRESADE